MSVKILFVQTCPIRDVTLFSLIKRISLLLMAPFSASSSIRHLLNSIFQPSNWCTFLNPSICTVLSKLVLYHHSSSYSIVVLLCSYTRYELRTSVVNVNWIDCVDWINIEITKITIRVKDTRIIYWSFCWHTGNFEMQVGSTLNNNERTLTSTSLSSCHQWSKMKGKIVISYSIVVF